MKMWLSDEYTCDVVWWNISLRKVLWCAYVASWIQEKSILLKFQVPSLFITPPCVIFAEWNPIHVDSKNSVCFALCHKMHFIAFLLSATICKVEKSCFILSSAEQLPQRHHSCLFLTQMTTIFHFMHVWMIPKTLFMPNPDFKDKMKKNYGRLLKKI